MSRVAVLIVEDDVDIREAEEEVLQSEGWEVHTARNGQEGLEALARLKKRCVVLLDLMMPVMDGLQFLQCLNETDQLREHSVIVISANTGEAASARALGAVAVLPKPFELGSLIQWVQREA